jgi:hypothetical protein
VTDFSTVACAEEAYTRQERYDAESGLAASVVLRCAYSNRHLLAADILMNRYAWPFGGWSVAPRASSAAIVAERQSGGPADGQAMNYTGDALVTVNYTTGKAGDPTSEDLISESLELTAEFITQDHRNFTWGNVAGGDPLTEQEAPGKQKKSLSLVRTFFQLPSIPVSILDLPGSSNDDDYTSALLGLTFPEETLLFVPMGMSRTIKSNGTAGWNLTISFPYQPGGWNKHWRAKTGLNTAIWNKNLGAVHKNFPPDDFSDWLF